MVNGTELKKQKNTKNPTKQQQKNPQKTPKNQKPTPPYTHRLVSVLFCFFVLWFELQEQHLWPCFLFV